MIPTRSLPRSALDLSPERVRARFHAARRRGEPAWLWPSISRREWRAALAAIEAATARVLAGDRALLDARSTRMGALAVAAYTSGMGPLLGHWMDAGRLDAGGVAAALFDLALSHGRARAERLTREAARVTARLAAAGVAVTVLKGMHTAHAYFPEPGARPLSDVDLHVPPASRRVAERVLMESGYEPGPAQRRPRKREWRPRGGGTMPRSLVLAHADDPWAIDLHLSLDRNFFGVGTVALNGLARATEPWVPWRDGAKRPAAARVLDQPGLTLLLAAQASEGLHNLSLLRLVELVLVIRRDSAAGRLDWSELLDVADETGARRFAYPALRLCEALGPGTLPPRVLRHFRGAAPVALRRGVEGLTPATAQRLEGLALADGLTWADGGWERARRLAHALWPPAAGRSLVRLAEIYERRAWQLLHRAGR